MERGKWGRERQGETETERREIHGKGGAGGVDKEVELKIKKRGHRLSYR